MKRLEGNIQILKKAFTLIELLVVIAIVAILVALIFPMLGKIQGRSQAIKCMGNLKSLGVGLSLYVAENNCYPGAHPSPGTFWIQAVDQYMTSRPMQDLDKLSPAVRCPGRALNTGTFGIGYGYNYAGFGCTPTSVGNGDVPIDQLPIAYWQLRPALIQHPSKVIVLGDGLDAPPPGSYAELYLYLHSIEDLAKRHAGGGNYLFADGHLEWLKPQTIKQLFDEKKPEPLYPF